MLQNIFFPQLSKPKTIDRLPPFSPKCPMSGISLRLCVKGEKIIHATTGTTVRVMQLVCGQEDSLLWRALQICVLLGFHGGIQQREPQLCLSWSFHPSCAEIVPGSHLLCSTFCVPVLCISISCFQIPSHPLLAHEVHHVPLAGTGYVFCPLHSSWSCVYLQTKSQH